MTKKIFKEESDEENSSAGGAASESGSDFDDDEDPDKIEVPGNNSGNISSHKCPTMLTRKPKYHFFGHSRI